MKRNHSLTALLASFLILPASGQLVLNEIHADPAGDISGDANGDGVRETSADEFVEIVNTGSASIDISGYTLEDSVPLLRHTFPAGTVLAPGQAVIVFGGGTPTGTFGGSLVQVSSEAQLGLNNGGDTITLYDGESSMGASSILVVTYGSEGSNDESLVLDPELTGTSYIGHSSAPGAAGAIFSPGTRVDSSNFAGAGESVTVTVSPDTFSEGDGASAATGTVSVPTAVATALTVNLASTDTTEATVPASVIIAAGQSSATFPVDAVEDLEIDETQTVQITASADGFLSGSDAIMVTDNEAPLPTIMLEAAMASISENGGSTEVTLTVSEASATGYSFTLTSNDTGELTVPATIDVPANETTVTFTATAVNDMDVDGTQTAVITATDTAMILVDATVNVGVEDDEAFTAPNVVINEMRIDDIGGDDDEYIELYSATPDISLGRLSIVVIGDGSGGSGWVERVIDLNGQTLNGNYFYIGTNVATLGTPDFFQNKDFLENGDNLTVLLVSDFSGAEGDDLDTNDDGMLETRPWGAILDGLAIIEEANPPTGTEYHYGTDLSLPIIGPAGDFVPAHVFRSPNATGDFMIGVFEGTAEAPALDTPGVENGTVEGPVTGDPQIVGFSFERSSGQGVISARNLGTTSYILQGSNDLNQNDPWVAISATESDNPDGSVNFTFSDPTATTEPKRFYRLFEQQ